MVAQPRPGGLIIRAGRGHQLPILARMVHAAKMHQLVNHHVVADRGRHEDEAPVQADMTVAPARAPSGSLVPDAHTFDREPVLRGQLDQTLPELDRCALTQDHTLQRTYGTRFDSSSLIRDPLKVLEAKFGGFPPGASARNCDAHAAVAVDPQHVPLRASVAYEVELDSRKFLIEWEPELHGDRIQPTKGSPGVAA